MPKMNIRFDKTPSPRPIIQDYRTFIKSTEANPIKNNDNCVECEHWNAQNDEYIIDKKNKSPCSIPCVKDCSTFCIVL